MLELTKTKYVRSSGVVSRLIADETLVVPIRSGVGDLDSIYSFNPVGSDIWSLLEKEVSLEEICAWVTEHYEVSEEQALGDIREFLGELIGSGLVNSLSEVPAV
jgi:hypothetical protein